MSKFTSQFRTAWKIFGDLEVAGFLPYEVMSPQMIKVPSIPGRTYEELASRCFSPLPDILPFLVDHDPGQVLSDGEDGRTTIHEDEDGIFFRLQLPSTPLGREIYELAMKDELGISPRMKVRKETDGAHWDDLPCRRILRAGLEEISLTTHPVYGQSCVRLTDKDRHKHLEKRLVQVVEGMIISEKPKVPFAIIGR